MSEPSSGAPSATHDARLPRETLAGDRLCMRCMHPLAGAPIEREERTGLLFVRCGECGTASALFEYPIIAPWIRRMKTVASGSLLAIFFVMIVALGGVVLGFTTGISETASGEAGSALFERFRALGGTVDEQRNSYSWGAADLTWLATDEGTRELAASRWAIGPLTAFVALGSLAVVVMTPFAGLLGIVLMARSPLLRASFCGLVVVAASSCAWLLHLGFQRGGPAPSWREVTDLHHTPAYLVLAGVVLALAAGSVAAVAPLVAAAVARFVLPPSDRRLVAWLWEWRGKSVPRD